MDILKEFFDEKHNLSKQQRDWLTGKKGVPVSAMTKLVGPAAMTIRTAGDRFEPFPMGKRALVFPEWQGAELIDLVAWDGEGVTSRVGEVVALGQACLDGWPPEIPVTVYRDPVSWMAHRMDGIVIADPHRAWELRLWFDHFEAEDDEHAAKVATMLTPPLPEILVSKISHEVAA